VFSRLGSFEALGVKFVTVQNSIDAAIELAEKSPQWKVEIPPAEKRQALHRARERVALFKGVQLLWVDDHPENNLNERRMVRQLGVDIDSTKSYRLREKRRSGLIKTPACPSGRWHERMRTRAADRPRERRPPADYFAGSSIDSVAARFAASISAAFFSTSSTRWSTMSASLRRWSVRPPI
jgi:hypothetical protein